jgi:alkylhydroperoxidase/carboxymuconolactone decarboxylase family protein YurZ
MTSLSSRPDLSSLDGVMADASLVAALQAVGHSPYAAAAEFWRVPMASPHLTPRVKELLLLAMHASAASLNVEAIERHIRRARAAGATAEDIVDVMITIVPLANHALYHSVPVLEDELDKAGLPPADVTSGAGALDTARERFLAARGFWNTDRERLFCLLPEYYEALTNIGTEPWLRGSLSTKEREFVCIAIDCTVTHTYEPGLRAHIRNAIKQGATKDEILVIFQLAALLGLEGYLLSARPLRDTLEPDNANLDTDTDAT